VKEEMRIAKAAEKQAKLDEKTKDEI